MPGCLPQTAPFAETCAKMAYQELTAAGTAQGFSDCLNVLTCMEMVGMIGKEEEDSVTLLCHDSTDRDVTTFSLDIKLMKRHFEAVWLKFLNCKLTQDQYRYCNVISFVNNTVSEFLLSTDESW